MPNGPARGRIIDGRGGCMNLMLAARRTRSHRFIGDQGGDKSCDSGHRR
jgi:hypothetical protein